MKRSAMALWLLLCPVGCGTDAVGVSECRQIEDARCEAAAKCGDVEDVAECKHYYNDHCLHGLPLDTAPRPKVVAACVATIKAAGSCASKQGAKTAPGDCKNSDALEDTKAKRVCDIVDEPQEAEQCSFLIAPEDDDEETSDSETEAESESETESKPKADAGSSKNSGGDSD
jgi:hypothetical protein